MGEIGSVAMCRRVFKYQTTESGDIPFFKIGSFGATPDAFISRDLFENLKIKYPYPEKGDVLISASGSIGRTVVFTGKDEYFQDSNIVWLKHDNSIINHFLKYLYSIVKWVGIEGTTIKRLYNDNILKTEVIIPTLSEQQKISNYLNRIDHLITLHQSKSFWHILEAIVSCTLSWEQRKFIDIAETRRGLTYKPTEISEDGIRVLRSSNINEDTFVKGEDDVFVDRKAINIPFVQNGDILITSANGSSRLVGKHAIIREIIDDSAVHGGFMLLATAKNPQFLNASMGASWYIKFINLFVAGGNGAIGNLNKNDLDEQAILVPYETEQKLIGCFFENLDHLITLHQSKLEKLQKIKKSMLESMFV